MTRQEQFKTELAALLQKYQVEMEVQEESMGYSTYATGISFYSPTKYADAGNIIADSINFSVGRWVDGSDLTR